MIRIVILSDFCIGFTDFETFQADFDFEVDFALKFKFQFEFALILLANSQNAWPSFH